MNDEQRERDGEREKEKMKERKGRRGERGREKEREGERVSGSGEIVRATAKRNETKRFSRYSYIYAVVDKPRLRSSNTQRLPSVVVRRRLRGHAYLRSAFSWARASAGVWIKDIKDT